MMEVKYQRILKYSEKDVQRILTLFRKQRDDPPLPRNYPPISGRIKWCRSLASHIEELVTSVTSHPVLKTLPSTKDLGNKYYSVRNILKEYEEEIVNIWLDQDVSEMNVEHKFISIYGLVDGWIVTLMFFRFLIFFV